MVRTLLLAAALGAAAPEPEPPKDPLQSLRTWVRRLDRSPVEFDLEKEVELQELLGEVRLVRLANPARARECDLVLIETAAHGWVPRPERREPRVGEDREPLVSILALQRLERLLDQDADGSLARWLALELLAQPREHDLPLRRVAADLLVGRHRAQTQSVLFATARAVDPLLRETAFRALAGWEDSAVHLFFLQQLRRERVSLPIVRAHFQAVRGDLEPAVLDRLRTQVGELFVSADWRDAVRALGLVDSLDLGRAVPLLIESLALWTRRLEEGQGSKRVQHEIQRELQRLSGRSIGPHPERWNLWWQAVQDGRVEAARDVPADRGVSAATFFGLRPVTDRVLFVIDRSLSMDSGFGTTGRTRYEEAVSQTLDFVSKLGPDARFNVTLFHTGADRWRGRLVDVTDSSQDALGRWLGGKFPDGGTQLYLGIATALGLDREGRVDPERLEADTVIVLCDGRTAGGGDWVTSWLERVNDEAQLVFHCVQIGHGGDGTLERLAAGTGGEFVRIDG